MYKISDKVFYPYYGVVTISDIISKKIAGSAYQYYVLQIPSEDMKVMVPAGKEREVGLRKLISRKEAKRVFELLEKEALEKPGHLNFSGALEKLESSNIFDVARGVSILLAKKEVKDLSWTERALLKRGLTILASELAAVRGVSVKYIKKQIIELGSREKTRREAS